MMLSGGVDSTVCAALLRKALAKEQVIAVHIDNGFMRKNESKGVEESLANLGLHVTGVRALIVIIGVLHTRHSQFFKSTICID